MFEPDKPKQPIDIIHNTEFEIPPRDREQELQAAQYLDRVASALMYPNSILHVRIETTEPNQLPPVTVVTITLRPSQPSGWDRETAVPEELFRP